MINSRAAEFFRNIKKYHKDVDDDFEQPPLIIPTLRSYQRRAVKWMVDRENNNDLIKSDGSKFSGGILADEMGLGKTVEMLCCIMANTAPSEFYNKKVSFEVKLDSPRKSSLPSTSKYLLYSSDVDVDKISKKVTREKLNDWYNSVLSSMSTVPKKTTERNNCVKDNYILECYCFKTPPNSTVVICAKCDKGQHAECVNFQPKPFEEVSYLCANCWSVSDKLQCKATLIVVPQSILNQWLDEIENHIAQPGLKVLTYNGVHSDGFIQPSTFNDYDIVLTSYNYLLRELNFTGLSNFENRNTNRLRHLKKYNYPQSPLPCLKWWRICLDEGQVIESTTCKVFEMTSCLESVHKWAMTGTPIQKSLNDLYGILKFLDVSPYCNRKQFIQLMNGDTTVMYSWFSNLMWRNIIEDVNSELNIPKMTYEQHWLTFSQIEKHFYLGQHNDCAMYFSNIVTKLFTSLDISVKDIHKKNISGIIKPLIRLRQACVHPQAVNGQFLKIKGTMSMENLMDVMIEKCRVNCNDMLRTLVSQHNAIAGLLLIKAKPQEAVEHYLTVLNLMEKYKVKQLKIDTCQKVHVMYNLATVIDEYKFLKSVIGVYDRENLLNDMEKLEKDYLGVTKQNIELTRRTVTSYSVKVSNIIGDKTLAYSDWWSDMLDWIFSPNDFLTKVQVELEDYRVPGVPNIGNKLKSKDDVYNILSTWLGDLDLAREVTLSELKKIEKTPMNDLVQKALICHMRLKSKKNLTKTRICLICLAESRLKVYESMLFSVSNKQKTLTDTTEETNEETMYESTSKGLWKMSQKEFLLMKLFQYGKAKIINENCLKDAAEHMKVLELVRKEFRYLRLLWTHLSDSLSAHDELVMAKSRLRLGDTLNSTNECDEDGPPTKKTKKNEENDVVMEQYVDYNVLELSSEIPNTEAALERKIGTLLYLENLKKEKENSTEVETCPICCIVPDSEWAVLQCGHSVCSQCLASLCNHTNVYDTSIACPLCRNHTQINSISMVKNNREGDSAGIVIKGGFSTKIENVTLKLIELIAQDPKVKVLIFSTWDKALDLLGEALDQNSVTYRRLKTGDKYKKTISDFKTNEKINALLLKMSLGAKGLNFTEASRIFFMEPIINKADELQAIGRVYRMGQTKPTFVHHFTIRDSVEENITKIFSTDKYSEAWDSITLSELIKVFERSDALQPENNVDRP